MNVKSNEWNKILYLSEWVSEQVNEGMNEWMGKHSTTIINTYNFYKYLFLLFFDIQK